MSNIVHHPGTGTFFAAAEAEIVDVNSLPDKFDDWEVALADGEYTTETMFVLPKNPTREDVWLLIKDAAGMLGFLPDEFDNQLDNLLDYVHVENES